MTVSFRRDGACAHYPRIRSHQDFTIRCDCGLVVFTEMELRNVTSVADIERKIVDKVTAKKVIAAKANAPANAVAESPARGVRHIDLDE